MPRALSKLLATQGKASVRDLDAVDLHTHVYLPRYMDILRARKDVPFVRPGIGGERLIILPAEQQQLGRANSSREASAPAAPLAASTGTRAISSGTWIATVSARPC